VIHSDLLSAFVDVYHRITRLLPRFPRLLYPPGDEGYSLLIPCEGLLLIPQRNFFRSLSFDCSAGPSFAGFLEVGWAIRASSPPTFLLMQKRI